MQFVGNPLLVTLLPHLQKDWVHRLMDLVTFRPCGMSRSVGDGVGYWDLSW